MNKKEKKILTRILIAISIFILTFIINPSSEIKLILFGSAYLISGADVLIKAVKNIFKGHVFDENFLMGIATLGAFGIKEYPEAAMVMILYQVGELFQSYAVGRSRKSISELMNIRPDYANIEKDGELIEVDPETISVGDLIVVKTGEKIPLDGIVEEGYAAVDTSALTGESIPKELKTGDTAISGCINLNGVIKIRITKEFGESTVSKILELVENASSRKAKAENFITKFARYYTPAVVIAAVCITTIPVLIIKDAMFSEWFQRALTFLVISCPCALVISVPLGFFGGIGGASKCGILIKGSNYLEALSNPLAVIFDKTGTLTKGVFSVTKIYPENISSEELLEYTAVAENYSNHPIALSIKKAYSNQIDSSRIKEINEISGNGIRAIIDDKEIIAGNKNIMEKFNIPIKEHENSSTVVHVAINGLYAGCIVISDEIKEDAPKAIACLKNYVKRIVMLTGDSEKTAEKVGKVLGISEVYANLLPEQKVEKVEEIIENKKSEGNVIFVGDGINDAPVLTRADIGIAMGGLGSDAAIEAADVVIMDDKPSKIDTAIKISRKTIIVVKQNIIFALGIKGLFLVLGAFGIVTMWGAIFADVGVSIIAIINSLRTLNIKKFLEE